MPTADVNNLRNVALLSHSGAGKTSLSEALLFHVNAVTRIGRVEDGNTVSDYEPEEIKRGGSVQTTLIACQWDNKKVNFLDTPGLRRLPWRSCRRAAGGRGRPDSGGGPVRGRHGDGALLGSCRSRRTAPGVRDKQDGPGECRLLPLRGGHSGFLRPEMRAALPGRRRCRGVFEAHQRHRPACGRAGRDGAAARGSQGAAHRGRCRE